MSLVFVGGLGHDKHLAGQSFPMLAGARFIIGREKKRVSLLLRSVDISRQHAALQPGAAGGGWVIEDCGSLNGTFVNGRKLHPKVWTSLASR
jgi:pSer/pThr/pTyr-binding forkhead associated (FHA) protein